MRSHFPILSNLFGQKDSITLTPESADELENALMCAAECGDIRATAEYYRDQVIPRMQELRAVGDQIEVNLGEEYLPYPTYGQLLFSVS